MSLYEGLKIKEARLKIGMTQKEFADAMDIPHNVIIKIENGETEIFSHYTDRIYKKLNIKIEN